MKHRIFLFKKHLPMLLLTALLPVAAPHAAAQSAVALPQPDISFRNEVQIAIDHGLLWLQANQNSNGWWSTPEHPALTGLAVSAFMGNPSAHAAGRAPETVARGYKFILANVKPDGGIYHQEDQNYNTSICLMALLAAHKPEYDAVALHARQWIIGQQAGGKENTGSPFDGGVGYGASATGPHTDMNNTYTALEALYYSKDLAKDKPIVGAKDLNWDAAIHFIERCQNLPSVNKEPWASDDPANKGGFIYFPGRSSAGSQTNADGRVSFRSYGTITYAGFLSYIYADLKRDDPRVTAAFDWLRNNYTLEENPGMGPAGYYYYLQMMSKALSVYGVNDLPLKDGKTVDWRRQLVSKIMKLQRTDGSWKNENERWLERDPVLATSYSLMALEIAYRGL
jgi:squalene-hopene/tetraprenyl-beta-curcumene cyclase